MIKLCRFAFFAILPFCFSLPVYGQVSSGVIIENISFEKKANDGETITFKLNDPRMPKMFSIKGEKPRLVFDFFDTLSSHLIQQKINTKGDLIQRIRVGVHHKPKQKTRVVVDLFPNKNVEVNKNFNKEDNTLVVTVSQTHTTVKEKGKKISPKKVPAEVVMKKGNSTGKKEPVAPKATKPLASKEIKPSVEKTSEKAGEKTESKPAKGKVSAEPFLSEITFENTSNKGEMVLFKLNDFYPPIVFGLEKGEPRVVCDFLGTTLGNEVKKVINSDGKFVKRIRVAKHKNPDKIRVVLDLTPNSNYDLQQVFFKEDNLFVIIINPFSNEDKKETSH